MTKSYRKPKYGLGASLTSLLGKGTQAGSMGDFLNVGLPAIASQIPEGKGDVDLLGRNVLSGVGMGAAFGPIGMAGGALFGGIKSLLDIGMRNKMERRRQEELRKNRSLQNEAQIDQQLELDKRRSVAAFQQFPAQGIQSAGYYSLGGSLVPQYEVEQGEVVQGYGVQLEDGRQVASDMHLVDGQKHSQGGTDGAGGDRVYSDRLYVSDELYQRLKNI